MSERTLHVFPRSGRLPNDSPFCLKAEAYLRLAGLEYRTVEGLPMRSPTRKLPMLALGRERITDSSRIVERLESGLGAGAVDAGLNPAQHAIALLVQRTVEEHLYWALVWQRWFGEDWQATRRAFFGRMPPGLRQLAAKMVRGKLARDVRGHGMALHGGEEILRRAAQDLEALSTLLGDQAFFLGQAAHSVDACVYGLLANILDSELKTPLTALAQRHPNLVAHTRRMQARCFPELG